MTTGRKQYVQIGQYDSFVDFIELAGRCDRVFSQRFCHRRAVSICENKSDFLKIIFVSEALSSFVSRSQVSQFHHKSLS